MEQFRLIGKNKKNKKQTALMSILQNPFIYFTIHTLMLLFIFFVSNQRTKEWREWCRVYKGTSSEPDKESDGCNDDEEIKYGEKSWTLQEQGSQTYRYGTFWFVRMCTSSFFFQEMLDQLSLCGQDCIVDHWTPDSWK